MKEYADLLFRSIIARDPRMLPLADRYAATENSVAGSLNMMSFWRTITGVKALGPCVVDPIVGQLFITANLDEGGGSTVFWGRLKIVEDKVRELELYNCRSRAEAGFWIAPDEMGNPPRGWSSPIPPGGRATREELVQVGRALFDRSIPAPESSPDCLLMELGGVVHEDPEYSELLMGVEFPPGQKEPVPIALGIVPFRPEDPQARVVAADEEQGIVVAIGRVPGFTSPYVISRATESCFVPECMIEMHYNTLKPERFAGRQVLEEMPAVAMTSVMVRVHSGLVQGYHMLTRLQGPGGHTPWVRD